jgi:hypothetical protein
MATIAIMSAGARSWEEIDGGRICHVARVNTLQILPVDPRRSTMPSSSGKELTMIEGLKLTMTGEELRTLIEQHVAEHQLKAAHWIEEAARTPDNETPETLLLPEHICENEATRHEWRAERLIFLRDHLDASETYRLDEMDLEAAGLLPEEPEMHGPDYPDDSEDLGPHARRVCDSPEIIEIRNPDFPA